MKNLLISLFSLISITMMAQNDNKIMYKKEIIRALDLRELQNISLYARGNEIIALFYDGILNKEIPAYTSDSLNNRLTITEFKKRIEILEGSINDDSGWATEDTIAVIDTVRRSYFLARDLYQMEINEKVAFNKEK